MSNKQIVGGGIALAMLATPALAGPADDIRRLAQIDTAYQAAVERNDADAMAAILHEDMILVLGNGATYTRQDLLQSAREQHFIYEHQIEDEGTQTVRLYGDNTAIITARLYLKAMHNGELVERRLWFTDTYVRTPEGWRYAFGQASLALPAE